MFLSPAELEQLLNNTPTGYKTPGDEFFATVNKAFVTEFKKLGVITDIADESPNDAITRNDILDCNVPGCNENFDSVAAYQTHFNSVHRYLCATCKRAMPTPHLLDLHISENHDSYFQARVERGEPMFACFLEECKHKLSTPTARREHIIKVHKFPSNFRFDKMGAVKKHKQYKSKMHVDLDNHSSTSAAATNTKIKSFTFGHVMERSFNKTCARKTPGATLENMNELMDALEED